MNPGEAVIAALDNLAAERTPYLSLRETVSLLGGTRAASAAFGVTQRAVQRWLKETPGQQRRLARSRPAIRAAVAREQRRLAGETLREDLETGFSIPLIFAEVRVSKDRRRRSPRGVVIIEEPDEEDIKALIDAWLNGDQGRSGGVFSALFFEAWGEGRMADASLGDVEELIIETGG